MILLGRGLLIMKQQSIDQVVKTMSEKLILYRTLNDMYTHEFLYPDSFDYELVGMREVGAAEVYRVIGEQPPLLTQNAGRVMRLYYLTVADYVLSQPFIDLDKPMTDLDEVRGLLNKVKTDEEGVKPESYPKPLKYWENKVIPTIDLPHLTGYTVKGEFGGAYAGGHGIVKDNPPRLDDTVELRKATTEEQTSTIAGTLRKAFNGKPIIDTYTGDTSTFSGRLAHTESRLEALRKVEDYTANSHSYEPAHEPEENHNNDNDENEALKWFGLGWLLGK